MDGDYGVAGMTAWMKVHWNDRDFDTEALRRTPYLAMQWLDREAEVPGSRGLPLQQQRFPPLAVLGGPEGPEVVDLGPIPDDAALPAREVALALVAVTLGWVAKRG